MSGDNYKESTSYGLNAHAGLGLVKENMKPDTDAELFSFADIYAAIEVTKVIPDSLPTPQP